MRFTRILQTINNGDDKHIKGCDGNDDDGGGDGERFTITINKQTTLNTCTIKKK